MIRGGRWSERRSVALREPSGVARATHPSTIALEPRPAPRASESVGSTATVSASKGLRLTSQWSRNSSTVGHTCNGGSVRRSDAAQYFEALTTTTSTSGLTVASFDFAMKPPPVAPLVEHKDGDLRPGPTWGTVKWVLNVHCSMSSTVQRACPVCSHQD